MCKKEKNGSRCTYFACGASKKPIISVSLLSGVLWDELKCEFNLLGAKVNFRRGISRCALWGVYAMPPLRDVSVGPKPQPQISVWQTAAALWCGGVDTASPLSLTPPFTTSLPSFPPSALQPGVWPEALLITQTLLWKPQAQGCDLHWELWHTHTQTHTPPPPTLSIKMPHQTGRGRRQHRGVKGRLVDQVWLILTFN